MSPINNSIAGSFFIFSVVCYSCCSRRIEQVKYYAVILHVGEVLIKKVVVIIIFKKWQPKLLARSRSRPHPPTSRCQVASSPRATIPTTATPSGRTSGRIWWYPDPGNSIHGGRPDVSFLFDYRRCCVFTYVFFIICLGQAHQHPQRSELCFCFVGALRYCRGRGAT